MNSTVRMLQDVFKMSSRWLEEASRWLEEASRWLEEECALMKRNRIHLEVQEALELWHGGGVDSVGRQSRMMRMFLRKLNTPETDRATCRTTGWDLLQDRRTTGWDLS